MRNSEKLERVEAVAQDAHALEVALVTFVAVELDVMVRVFMLIVGGLYQVYPIPIEALPTIFVLGAIQTPLEAAYALAVATVVGVPVLIGLEKSGILSWPLR